MADRLVVPAAFGAALYRHRMVRGWSLQRAALAAGVSTMTVRRAEQCANVGLAYVLAVAGAYGTTVDALLGVAPGAEGRA